LAFKTFVIFTGNELLFYGLYASERRDWSVKFSVICISLGSGVRKTIEDLHTTIQRTLRLHEGKWNIPAQCSDIPGRFADLIAAATRSSGQVGVILING
jgi:hypothetical protein